MVISCINSVWHFPKHFVIFNSLMEISWVIYFCSKLIATHLGTKPKDIVRTYYVYSLTLKFFFRRPSLSLLYDYEASLIGYQNTFHISNSRRLIVIFIFLSHRRKSLAQMSWGWLRWISAPYFRACLCLPFHPWVYVSLLVHWWNWGPAAAWEALYAAPKPHVWGRSEPVWILNGWTTTAIETLGEQWPACCTKEAASFPLRKGPSFTLDSYQNGELMLAVALDC